MKKKPAKVRQHFYIQETTLRKLRKLRKQYGRGMGEFIDELVRDYV